MSTSNEGPETSVFPLIYGELRRLARGYLLRERANHTLQPTALVHEARLRLRNDRAAAELKGRTHGLALSSPEVAEHLVISLRTVEAEWAHARAWLKRYLSGVRT